MLTASLLRCCAGFTHEGQSSLWWDWRIPRRSLVSIIPSPPPRHNDSSEGGRPVEELAPRYAALRSRRRRAATAGDKQNAVVAIWFQHEPIPQRSECVLSFSLTVQVLRLVTKLEPLSRHRVLSMNHCLQHRDMSTVCRIVCWDWWENLVSCYLTACCHLNFLILFSLFLCNFYHVLHWKDVL